MLRQKPTRLVQAISSGVALLALTAAGAERQTPRIEIERPLQDERFVARETVTFRASVRGVDSAARARAVWSSSAAGELGRGAAIEVRSLPAGTQDVTVSLDGVSQSVRIRAFDDLLELYRAKPADAELERLRREFSFTWQDGPQPDERWALYEPSTFALESPRPSKTVLLARLDALRHQAFDEPLPFGDGPVFEYLRRYVRRFVVGLECGSASGGGGTVRLPRHASIWYASTSNCREVLPGQPPLGYEGPLGLILHEVRHNHPGDPGHRACRSHPALDASLDNGSGFAWSTLYFMWVYKYGSFDPPEIKERARQAARSMLQSSFCSAPSSSNPKVQAIVEEILTSAYFIFRDGVAYRDLGPDYLDQRDPGKLARRLAKRIEALGFSVDLRPAA
jgi:hypothetical protein